MAAAPSTTQVGFLSLSPIICGAGLGVLVWRFDAPTTLALLLPVIWLAASRRMVAGGAVAAYYLAGVFDLIDAGRMFFGSWSIGIAAWLLQAIILAIPWVLLWTASHHPGQRVWRVALVLLVTVIPPVGIFNWISPMLAAGELFPGAGVWGLLATLVLVALIVLALMSLRRQGREAQNVGVMASVALGILIVWWSSLLAPTQPVIALLPLGWQGLDTDWGYLPPADSPSDKAEQFQRVTHVKQLIANIPEGKTVFLAESVVGWWRPAVQYWLNGLGQPSARRGGRVFLGADVPAAADGQGYINALVDAGSGEIMARARIPMPISLWRPWEPERNAQADPLASGLMTISGVQAAVSFCYEDFLVWPHVRSHIAAPDSTVVVSVANNWFVRDGSHASIIQRRSIDLVARLFGWGVVRAVNH